VTFAGRRGYLEGDPMRGIDNPSPTALPPSSRRTTRSFVPCSALSISLTYGGDEACRRVQLLTGARPSEVRLMTWSR
jgi:hypothetical protein